MVFDAAKSLDRVTITVYQSAAGNNILTWLQNAVDKLITALGNAIYFPYLIPVILLGAMWLAWQGLVRKRATRTLEGTLWMVMACVAAIWLIGKPADFTGVGTTVSNGVTQVLNTAFSNLPSPGGSNCLPVQTGDHQSVTANYNFTSGNGLVDQDANELWSVLVCKPWLDGELGTTEYATTANGKQTLVNAYGRQLLWAQAIASDENATTPLIQAKQSTYEGIANQLKQNNPGVYPLFQGNQWTTRLEIAFAAVFAAVVAGLLIMLIALTLIMLKLGFLLLLVAGPFFLIVGTHPGFGRVIAIRWFEMIVGILMKQVAIAITLSVLLYCYSLIMGTADAVLPWALKILMIALVTVTVFIYRKPFQHLFSAVGYGTIGSQERAEYSLRQAGSTFRRAPMDAAGVAIPGVAGYRAARWARRNPGQAAALVGVGGPGSAAATAGAVGVHAGEGSSPRLHPDAAAAADGVGVDVSAAARRKQSTANSAARARSSIPAEGSDGRAAPPLQLPPRSGGNGSGTNGAGSNGSRTPNGSKGSRGPNGSNGSNGSRGPSSPTSGARRSESAPPVWPAQPLAGRPSADARQAAIRRGEPAVRLGSGSAASQQRGRRAVGAAVLAPASAAGQVAGGRHGSQRSTAEAAVRRHRHRAGCVRLLPGLARGPRLAARPGGEQREQAASGAGHDDRAVAVRGIRGVSARGEHHPGGGQQREHLQPAAVHTARPGQRLVGGDAVRRGLQHVHLYRERRRLRREHERPDHHRAGRHLDTGLPGSRRRNAQEKPEGGVHRHGDDHPASVLQPGKPDLRGRHHPAPGQLERHQRRAGAVRRHRQRLGHRLAGQRHRAGQRG